MPANSTITVEQNMQALKAGQEIHNDQNAKKHPLRNRVTTILLIIAIAAIIGICIYFWFFEGTYGVNKVAYQLMETLNV